MSCGTHATAEVSFPLLFRSMRGTFRVVAPLFAASSAASSRLSPVLAPSLPRNPPSPLRRLLSALPPMSNHSPAATPPSAAGSLLESSSFKKQFDDFRVQLEESGNVRERIRAVVMEVEAAVRLMHSSLLLVHHTVPNSEVLDKARAQIEVLKGVFHKLTDILRDCPGQYYRYHGDWRSETQTSVSLIAFLHWLETGNLLVHAEAEKKLGLDKSEFGLDVEDYLIGLCFMSNELPRYVVNQVTAGNYDCPRKVLMFLTDLHAAFRMLNLRNDFLRKKFDGMKYDLRRVEEVYYDVKIRGLGAEDSIPEQNTQT